MKREKETGFHFEDLDKYDFAHKLIENIGDLDPVIRDGLIYVNLAHLFYDGHFDKEQLIHFFEILISDNYLMYDMENIGEHSELKRSFTILQLVYFIYLHNKNKLLTNKQYMNFFTKFMKYFNNETILKGYDAKVGWMHTIAHSADLIAQIVESKEMNKKTMEELFLAVRKKFAISSYNYVSDEDERMVTALMAALEREILEEEFVIGWIHSFSKLEKPKTFPDHYNFKNNIKNLLRSLYFRLGTDKKYKTYRTQLEEVIVSLEKK